MNKDELLDLALFKYGIISPVLHDNIEGQNKYFKLAAQKTYDVPHLGKKKYTLSTFKHWLRNYRKWGLEGVTTKIRSDKGKSNKITGIVITEINSILENPFIKSSAQVYKFLIKNGCIAPGDFSEQTLRKFIRENKLLDKSCEVQPRKKFEMEHINQLWMSDFTEIRILTHTGKKTRRVWLCVIIDDFSRVIVGYNWDFNENISSLIKALKSAVLRFGIPQKFFCDNGSAFKSTAFSFIAARLNIALIHSKPYDAPSRGLVERFNQTMKNSFLPLLYNKNLSLNELDILFSSWLENEYHKSIHKGINNTPLNKYLDDIKNVPLNKLPDNKIEEYFYTSAQRSVNNDSTIAFNNQLYEVDPKYIGEKISLRYNLSTPDVLFLVNPDSSLTKLAKCNPTKNAHPPHVSISYSKLLKDNKEDK